MKKSNLLFLTLLSATTLFFTACNEDEPNVVEPTTAYDFIAASANHTSLTAAIDAAGLASTLDNANSTFTVFAPDNDAFSAFLTANNFASLDAIPVDVLTNVLLNHVLGAKVNSGDLTSGYVSTLSPTSFGSEIMTSLYVNLDSGVRINGVSSVTGADNDVANGTVHVVDAVIGLPTVVTFATSNPALSSLVAALTAAGLPTDFVSALSGDGPFTVFAPTNDAFQALLDSDPNWNTVADIPTATLDAVLKYHVTTAGNVRSTDLSNGQTVPTLQGSDFTIDLSGANPVINAGSNSANIITSLVDIQTTNGVVHVIDSVILP